MAEASTLKSTERRRGRILWAVIALVMIAAFAVLLAACSGGEDPTPTGDPISSLTPGTQPTPGTSASSSTTNVVPADYTGFYSKKEGTVYYSPSSVCVDNGQIFVSDATNFAVYRFTSAGALDKTAFFDGTVTKVLASGERVYALVGEYGGKLVVLDRDLNTVKSVTVGHTPTDLYLNGNTAYVCNRFSGSVSVVDLDAGRVTAAISVSREPVCMAAAGNTLYVGSRLQDETAENSVLSSKIVKIDMTTNAVSGSISLQNGATNVRGMAASSDGSKIYVSHTVARYGYPTMFLDRGWVNTNGFSIIDTATDKPTAFLLDDVELGAPNPWDVELSEDGNYLFFAISGGRELIRVRLAALNNAVSLVENGRNAEVSSVDEIIDHIEFLSGAKTRIKLDGEGVRDLFVSDGKVYAAEYFSGTVSVVNASDMNVQSVFSVGAQPAKDDVRQGESLWFDATYCYQQWESCSSCHPDARPDALNWDEGGDGWGTPKNTKSMIFSLRTPPVLATGCMESGEANIMGTVREAFRSKLGEEKVETMYAFLRSLLPVDSPYLNENGGYTEAALRGKQLFESIGCSVCHPAPLYSDLKFHTSPYLGSDGSWENRDFITPTLVEIWRSAPYTYSGRVGDVKDVIRQFSRTPLTDDQVEDLAQFVLSIGVVNEYYGVSEVFASKDGAQIISALLPGETLERLTVIKQIPSASGVPDPVITVKLCAEGGSVISEKSFTPGAMAYDREVSLDLGISVPSDLAAGGFLSVSIADPDGNALATVYKLIYNG